jgi:NADH-quinone oxidoreductase subunit L
VLLAIPSVVIGYMTIAPMLFGDFFKDSIIVNLEQHPAMEELAKEFRGAGAMAVHVLTSLPFWLALAGVVLSYVFYMLRPEIPAAIKARFGFIYRLLDNKYYMDWFNEHIIAPAARAIGTGLWKGGDMGFIDGIVITGSVRTVNGVAALTRALQSGYLYWYALVMIMGVIGLMTWQLWPFLGSLLGR